MCELRNAIELGFGDDAGHVADIGDGFRYVPYIGHHLRHVADAGKLRQLRKLGQGYFRQHVAAADIRTQ